MPPSQQQNRVVFAPLPYKPEGEKSVFLSGSINKEHPTWQTRLSSALSSLPITILNPHRTDWDSTWVEDISDQRFSSQVEWELDMMEAADVIAVYFSPDSEAPITLLELGLFARTGKVVVACPDGYWKKGNVQVVCKRFGIELQGSLEELQTAVEERLRAAGHV
jgi:hypothetical protein